MKDPKKQYRNRFIAAIVGAGAVALCCFTPILVLSLGVVGLSAMTPYLDFVLLPALVILVFIAILSHQKWKNSQK